MTTKTQLVFTVGTSPLPVWVAWKHLKEKLNTITGVWLVHSNATKSEAERLQEKIQEDGKTSSLIEVCPGNPKEIEKIISENLQKLSGDVGQVHIHYTGGTKAMVVHTVRATKGYCNGKNKKFETSYLDPRGSSGPRIVDETSTPLVHDTRRDISADIVVIAWLNGFEFTNNGKDRIDAPIPISKEDYEKGKSFLNSPMKSVSTDDGKDFEKFAFVAIEQTLQEIEKKSSLRNNFSVFINACPRRSPSHKHYELDVVVLLGYQLLLISCYKGKVIGEAKKKAIEAIIRSRQLGGIEAQAIMLCGLKCKKAKKIEKIIAQNMGSGSKVVEVWGKDKWGESGSLQINFKDYLNDLGWI